MSAAWLGRAAASVLLAAWLGTSAPIAGQVASDDGFDPAVAHPAFPAGGGPRLVVDEGHRNLHTAGGRYSAFAHVATLDGFRVEGSKEPFGATSPPSGVVLVIANASGPEGANSEAAFTTEEISALVRWIEDGGALFLITDHSPFGAAASNLGRALGVGMSDGEVNDVEHQARELPGPSFLEFTPGNGLLGAHAITTGTLADERVSRIVTFGGQALVPPEGAAVLLRLGSRAIASAVGSGPETAVGGEAQMIAFERGRGRVVITGEAGMFGAQVLRGEASRRAGVSDPFYFGMNLPGCDNKQLLLNTLRWLARAAP